MERKCRHVRRVKQYRYKREYRRRGGKVINVERRKISRAVISRLPRYYRYLGDLLEIGVERISSNDLSKKMNVTASQIRQDLNNFGGFGQQGYGYNVKYLYTDWSFDEAAGTYTFQLSNDTARSPRITKGMTGKSVRTSEKVAYQGIPYYMQQMNTWIRGFADKVNEIFNAGTNAYGDSGAANQGNILFTADMVNGKQYSLDDLKGATPNNTYGRYYVMTAGNFSINHALLSEYGGDADLLGTRSSNKVGVEECEQVKEVITLLTSKEKFSFRNASANQMLELLLSDIALNASNANTFQKTYKGLKTSIDNQRSSVSGVDKDEEAVSLVKYQNSYTLASKMIQTLTEIYDQLILNTGV